MDIHRICITGAGSMIGRALTEYAVSQGVEVLALTRPGGRRAFAHPLCRAVDCDLSDLAAFTPDGDCDAFVHLGWRGTYGSAREDASLQADNVRCALDAAALAGRLGCKCFLFAGSQAEYGPCDTILRPDTETKPTTQYGKAKLEAGRRTADFCRRHGIRHVRARILSVYGAEDRPETLVRTCISKMLEDLAPELTDCTQIWDYLYVGDAARALFLLCQSGRDGAVYPVGSGEGKPLRDYVETIRELTRCSAEPLYGARPIPRGSVTHLQADISALTADTGFVPAVSFREGITRILKQFTIEQI